VSSTTFEAPPCAVSSSLPSAQPPLSPHLLHTLNLYTAPSILRERPCVSSVRQMTGRIALSLFSIQLCFRFSYLNTFCSLFLFSFYSFPFRSSSSAVSFFDRQTTNQDWLQETVCSHGDSQSGNRVLCSRNREIGYQIQSEGAVLRRVSREQLSWKIRHKEKTGQWHVFAPPPPDPSSKM
jgi:hypothetical protein